MESIHDCNIKRELVGVGLLWGGDREASSCISGVFSASHHKSCLSI